MTGSDYELERSAAATTGRQNLEATQQDCVTPTFTPRQLDVLSELAKDKTNKEIGKALSLSPETVNHHLKAIFPKLGVDSRDGAVVEACRRGIISSNP